MKPHAPLRLEEFQHAQNNIRGTAVRTPLVQLNVDLANTEIYLKLENLQPIGSFKLRGAINAMRSADPERLEAGVWTASMGNMAQGVAWAAREMGIKATVVVPEDATRSKLAAMEELGASIRKIPRDAWFDLILYSHDYPGMAGLFIHPASNRYVMAIYPGVDPRDAAREIEACLEFSSREDPFLSENPPTVEYNGFFSRGYVLEEGSDAEKVLSQAHAVSFGSSLESFVTPGYLDGRVFVLYDDCPCLVYGPVSKDIHAFDERVSLASVQRITGTIALFIANWCGLEKLN